MAKFITGCPKLVLYNLFCQNADVIWIIFFTNLTNLIKIMKAFRKKMDYSKFVIANFINQALENGKIIITSSDQTLRTYVDASDQLEICFTKLFESKLSLINSGGFQISLFDLANLIYKVLSIKRNQTRNFVEKLSGDDYISKDFILNELGTLYGVELTSIEDQVKNTINLIKRNKLKSI